MCVYTSVCRVVLEMQKWMWFIAGRSTESLAGNNLLHLLLLLLLLHFFLVPHVKWRQECTTGETTRENSLLPEAIWQGWITNRTHTQTHTLCRESTFCLIFAHSWWLKCENALARGHGSGWVLARSPTWKKFLRLYGSYILRSALEMTDRGEVRVMWSVWIAAITGSYMNRKKSRPVCQSVSWSVRQWLENTDLKLQNLREFPTLRQCHPTL